jgi:uncharacterized membrane protein YfcA
MPDTATLLLLILTGFIAGVCNAVAGGGTFFTLPIFLAAGLPPVLANASNALAVWPGHILATVTYRHILWQHRKTLLRVCLIGLIGAVIGSWLLSQVGNARFRALIPMLILVATLLFAFGKQIHDHFAHRPMPRSMSLEHLSLLAAFIQLILAVYGGFFSAGLGVMLMAMLMLFGVHDMQLNNAFKNAIASVISTVAVLIFILNGMVVWSHALPAFAACIVGGIVGAKLAQRLPAQWLKSTVVTTGLMLTVYYAVTFFKD